MDAGDGRFMGVLARSWGQPLKQTVPDAVGNTRQEGEGFFRMGFWRIVGPDSPCGDDTVLRDSSRVSGLRHFWLEPLLA